MTRQRIALLCFLALTLFFTACSPEAKKQKAVEGGNKYFEKGQYKQARLMYLNAIKVDPRFGEAYYRLALTNFRLGAYAEAVGNLQRAVELQPDNLDAHSKLADLYLTVYAQNPNKNKQLMNDIRDLAAKMEKRGKDSYEDFRLRGFIAMADGRAEDGLALFRQADKKKPNQPLMEITIARTLLGMKRFDEAETYLRSLIAKDRAFSSAYDLLYGLETIQNKHAEAEKVLLDRARDNPKDTVNRIRLAAHYFTNNKRDQVDNILNDTLAHHADFADAFVQVGDFYYRIREFDRAAEVYQQGAKLEPARSRFFDKRLVEVRVAQNRSQEALEICERVLKEDKTDAEAIAMRASLWLYAGKPEQINAAIVELQSVVSKMQDNFVLRYNLGRALLAKGDVDAARVQFVDALKVRPDYLPARIALAQVLISRREFAAAMSAANEILQIDPNNQYARLIQANALLAQEKFSESKAVLESTLKLNPNQRDAMYQLGYVLFKEGKIKEAENYFRQLYAMTPPDMRGLMGLTEVYTSQNQNDKALQLLDEAIAKHPNAAGLLVARGNISIRAKRYDEGLLMYRRALAGDPKNFDLHMRIAEGLFQKGDLEGAIGMWKQAGEILPNATVPLVRRAMALDQVRRRSEAAAIYEQVLRVEPDNLLALNNYSFYLADQGSNLDLALSYAQKARSKAPNDPNIADTLGFIYLKKNLPQNAASIFNELSGKYPNVALFQIRLATAYLQSGEKGKARQSLDIARKKNPTKSDLEEIQRLAGKIG